MKISKLRRALAVFLSAAMLIMCMPFTGITAAAVTDATSCLYVTITGTEDITTLEEATAKVPESEWTSGTLTEALKVANKPHSNNTVYIKLLSDVTAENYGKTITFSSYSGNTVFDLNGNTVDGGNGYRCILISEDYGISKPITITSSAAQRGTITNGMSNSAGAGGIDQNRGKLLLSNLDIINNQTSGMYAAGFYADGNSTTLSNVKITGNKSLNSNDAYGGVMTYCPFTFKGKVEITGNGNNLGSNNRDLWIVSKGDKSSVSGLTAGSNISLYNPNNKGFIVSSDGGNNPDIYNYFSVANSGFWISPTSSGGIQVTNSVYGVVFDMQGKTDNVVNTVSSGEKATKPTEPTASDGSTFGGWYMDKACTEEFDFTAPITQNTTVYAKWEAPAGITITLDPNYTGSVTSTVKASDEGKLTEAQLAAPTRTDYVFMGWFDAETGGNEVTTATTFTENKTIYAQWVKLTEVSKVEITLDYTKYPKVIIGETADGSKFNSFFTIAESNNASVNSIKITDAYGNNVTVYAADINYKVVLNIKPADGYMFTESTTIADSNYNYVWDTNLNADGSIDAACSIGTAFNGISEVTINVDETKLPKMIIGEDVDTTAFNNVFSDDSDLYGAFVNGVYYKDAQGEFVWTNTYEDGIEYYLLVDIILGEESKSLYKDDATITITGTGKNFENPLVGRQDILAFFPVGTASEETSTEDTIKEVTITVDTSKLPKLIAGQTASGVFVDYLKAFTLSEGVSFENIFGFYDSNKIYTTSVVAGNDYYMYTSIRPSDLTKVFDDSVTIKTIGGTTQVEIEKNNKSNIMICYYLGTAYEAETPENKAEKAASDIDLALDSLKPTNDTTKDDVQKIVDDNKGDTTATVTTFELTPATEDKDGSLKVVVTVSDGTNTETVTKTYTISKLPASTDEGDIIVDTENNVGGAGVDSAEVKKAVEITPEEQALIDSGEDLYIILNVENADSTVSAEDKALTHSVLSENMTVEMYLDITLFKKIGTLQTAVTTTTAPITISFAMPEALINTDKNVTRTYYIIRVHDGKADILECAFDPATGKASFMTDKFSSYAIAYVDIAEEVEEPVDPVTNAAEEAAEAADKALDEYTPDNSTTADDILDDIKKVTGDEVTVEITSIVTVPATTSSEGSITVIIKITDSEGNIATVEKVIKISKLPEPEKPAVTVYYPVITSGNVSADRSSAAAGETVNVKASFGYDIIVTAANGRQIAKMTENGSFVMPASKVYVTAVQNETFALMATAWRNSYVYSYDSDMNKIKVSSTKKQGVIVVNLGEDYAGKSFTIYSGRKSTDVKVTDGKLDSKGRFKFEVPDGKNYTLVVED